MFAQLDQDSPLEVTHLMDLGLFRVLPGVLKRYAFDGTMGLISYYLGDALLLGLHLNIYRANEVLDFMTDHMHVTSGAPTARLIHLLNTHPPYMRDRHCQFIGVQKRINRQGMTAQTACAVDRFTAVLDAMETHGIYDSAMVILVADTGASSPYGERDMANLYAAREAASAGAMGRLMGGANPVLVIKYPGSDGPLRVSKTAAQLTDIPHTVCAALGHCQHHRGIDLATSPPNPDRIRRYHDYTWKHEYWGLHNIPGIVTYDITGPLWRASTWTRTQDADLPHTLNQIAFSEDDDPGVFGMGWSYVEVNPNSGVTKRWALGASAELLIPVEADQDLQMTFTLSAAPNLERQTVTLVANGTQLDTQPVRDVVHTMTFTVPRDVQTSGVVDLRLQFGTYRQADNRDQRPIAVAFYNLDIYALPIASRP